VRLLIVTGLPATGKTTLARELAARYRVPLLAKDVIKESLLQEAGAVDAVRSRQLSDLAFNMLFAQLRQLADAGIDTIAEGNFRTGQHETLFCALPDTRIAQVLCRTDEAQRLQRIAARRHDPARHPGHGDAHAARDASNDAFLDLAGEQILLPSPMTADESELQLRLDRWWHQSA
jgi:predicted kinase